MYKMIMKIMDNIAQKTLVIIFTIIAVLSFFIKAMYHFEDYPYFTNNNFLDLICALIVLLIYYFLFKHKEYIQQHTNYMIGFVGFIGLLVLYILLVPTTPFSDMTAIYNGALNFSTFQWDAFLQDDYWKSFSSNIYLAVLWGILIIPFPKHLITLKIINALFAYGIILLTRETAKQFNIKYYNLVYWVMLSFLPFFLYINCVYAEMPLIFFLMLGIWIYKKSDNIILSFVVLGFARYLRSNTLIVVLAIIFCYLFKHKINLKKRSDWKVFCKLVIAALLYFCIYKGLLSIVHALFIGTRFVGYPKWNIYYIGINEAKFGFMDGDFSYDRTFQDIINRVSEYGPIRMIKIFVKKTFWLWSQGTYQAQRYAFGQNVTTWNEKFEYSTFVTNHLLNDEQILRRIINSFGRCQYLALFVLMIRTLYKKNYEKIRLFSYIFMATFLIMIIYELKSRFILSLLPLMIILACDNFETLKINKRLHV